MVICFQTHQSVERLRVFSEEDSDEHEHGDEEGGKNDERHPELRLTSDNEVIEYLKIAIFLWRQIQIQRRNQKPNQSWLFKKTNRGRSYLLLVESGIKDGLCLEDLVVEFASALKTMIIKDWTVISGQIVFESVQIKSS